MCDLLPAALRARAVLDVALCEGRPVLEDAPNRQRRSGARQAVVQAGIDQGLATDDAERNARFLTQQLGVFDHTPALHHDEPGEGRGMSSGTLPMRTLASQASLSLTPGASLGVQFLTNQFVQLDLRSDASPEQVSLKRTRSSRGGRLTGKRMREESPAIPQAATLTRRRVDFLSSDSVNSPQSLLPTPVRGVGHPQAPDTGSADQPSR